MTRRDKEEAIRVAQVTYLLEGGPKERMVVVIPQSWVEDFPHYDYVGDIDLTAPKVISRNAFVEAVREEMAALMRDMGTNINQELFDAARNKVGTVVLEPPK